MRQIVINLYDHTPAWEIGDILSDLDRIGLDYAYVTGMTPRQCAEWDAYVAGIRGASQ
jgi:hypothetical protein